MKRIATFLVGLALAWLPAAHADGFGLVMRWPSSSGAGEDSLRLFNEPCTDPKVQTFVPVKVPPQLRDKLQAARLVWGGVVYQSCWVEIDRLVYSMDEKGDLLQPPLPKRLFKDEGV